MPPTDPNRESLKRRLAAVERALAEDEPIERASRLDDLEARIAELEAAVQALRGYVGAVRAVNEDVEQRADVALRKASALERYVSPDAGQADDPESRDEQTNETDAGDAEAVGVLSSLRRLP